MLSNVKGNIQQHDCQIINQHRATTSWQHELVFCAEGTLAPGPLQYYHEVDQRSCLLRTACPDLGANTGEDAQPENQAGITRGN